MAVPELACKHWLRKIVCEEPEDEQIIFLGRMKELTGGDIMTIPTLTLTDMVMNYVKLDCNNICKNDTDVELLSVYKFICVFKSKHGLLFDENTDDDRTICNTLCHMLDMDRWESSDRTWTQWLSRYNPITY